MSRRVFAANWKMNHGPSDARDFLRSFLQYYPRHSDRQVILFPAAVTLSAVVDALKERSDIRVGVQNIHWEAKGAFTGEISASMARDAGAHFALVGHSERRHVFGETDEETGKKVAACFRAGLIPILCIGEKLEERERGETDVVVLRQLRAGFGLSDPNQISHALIAYEPVWAIGTGKNATPEDASRVHRLIRYELKLIAPEKYSAIPILYGGSVNRGNAPQLLAATDVDGVLVGGASLDAEGWSAIVRA
jgi:triosephosphate isomerase (TIM)